MPFDARVFSVMIASPSDMEEERGLVNDVIADWNAAHARRRCVVLLAATWERDTHPELTGRPQEIINAQVLSGADLVVGLFWSRIGSHTGKEEGGAVEEIKAHAGAGKPAMLYFSNVDIPQARIDLDQLSKLRAFRSWANAAGLVHQFHTREQFRADFSRHLAAKVETLLEGVPIGSRTERSELSTHARSLLEALRASGSKEFAFPGGRPNAVIIDGAEFTGTSDVPSQQTWKRAAAELQEAGVIVDVTGRGELFRLGKA